MWLPVTILLLGLIVLSFVIVSLEKFDVSKRVFWKNFILFQSLKLTFQ